MYLSLKSSDICVVFYAKLRIIGNNRAWEAKKKVRSTRYEVRSNGCRWGAQYFVVRRSYFVLPLTDTVWLRKGHQWI